MNILMTSPYPVWPINSGGAARTYNIARSLAEIGHPVILLNPGAVEPENDEMIHWAAYADLGVIGHFINPSFLLRFMKTVKSKKTDLIICEFPYQAFMVMPFAKRYGIPVIYDAHNVEKDRFYSMGSRVVSYIVGLSENYLCRRASRILSVSGEDASVFKTRYAAEADVLPNGVDLEKFQFSAPSPELLHKLGLNNKKVVLYFGAFNYSPNVEALNFLVKDVWPKVCARVDNACLLVVGKGPPEDLKSTETMIVTGLVDDIVDYIQLAHVVAVPLYSGGGSRLKIIEALACGKTVLSTEFGAMGFLENKGQGLKISSHENFAEDLIETLKTGTRDMNKNSRNIASKFGWKNLVNDIRWETIQ